MNRIFLVAGMALCFLIAFAALGDPKGSGKPYELILIDDNIHDRMVSIRDMPVFEEGKNISMTLEIRDLGVKKMIAPDLYWGLSVVWDDKEYKRDPKHKGNWNGPWEIIPKTAWRTGFSLAEYLVPAEALTAGRHTVGLKDAFSESNILTVFIVPKNR